MFAATGSLSVGSPLAWTLVFARQPEPDLEFTEEELEQTTNVRSSSPMKTPKKSGGRPTLWLLLLLLVAGGAYIAMEPEMITDFLGQILGESPTPPAKSPVAARPAPSVPAPSAPGQPAPAAPVPQASTPAPVPPPAPSPVPNGPMASAPAPSALTPSSTPPAATPPSPLFGEGQKVTVVLSAATPGDTVTLMQDAAGTRPGTAVRPGATLTVLDGDLQAGGWVYSVRTDDGAKGWINENRLRLKP